MSVANKGFRDLATFNHNFRIPPALTRRLVVQKIELNSICANYQTVSRMYPEILKRMQNINKRFLKNLSAEAKIKFGIVISTYLSKN